MARNSLVTRQSAACHSSVCVPVKVRVYVTAKRVEWQDPTAAAAMVVMQGAAVIARGGVFMGGSLRGRHPDIAWDVGEGRRGKNSGEVEAVVVEVVLACVRGCWVCEW